MASEFLTELGAILLEFQLWQLEQQKKEAGIDAPIAKQDIDSGQERADQNGQQDNHTTDQAAEKEKA